MLLLLGPHLVSRSPTISTTSSSSRYRSCPGFLHLEEFAATLQRRPVRVGGLVATKVSVTLASMQSCSRLSSRVAQNAPWLRGRQCSCLRRASGSAGVGSHTGGRHLQLKWLLNRRRPDRSCNTLPAVPSTSQLHEQRQRKACARCAHLFCLGLHSNSSLHSDRKSRENRTPREEQDDLSS